MSVWMRLCQSTEIVSRRNPPTVTQVAGLFEKLFTILDLCVSSLRRGHANLLCIVPIFSDSPRRGSGMHRDTRGRRWDHHRAFAVWLVQWLSTPKRSSRSGNRTPGASVTGSNVTNYTNRDKALTVSLQNGAPTGIRARVATATTWSPNH